MQVATWAMPDSSQDAAFSEVQLRLNLDRVRCAHATYPESATTEVDQALLLY